MSVSCIMAANAPAVSDLSQQSRTCLVLLVLNMFLYLLQTFFFYQTYTQLTDTSREPSTTAYLRYDAIDHLSEASASILMLFCFFLFKSADGANTKLHD